MTDHLAPDSPASAFSTWPEPPADAARQLRALQIKLESCLREGQVLTHHAQWRALAMGVRAAMEVLTAQERTADPSPNERNDST